MLRAAAAAALRPEATRVITFKDLLKVRSRHGCSRDLLARCVGVCLICWNQGGEDQDRVGSSDVMEVMQRMVA